MTGIRLISGSRYYIFVSSSRCYIFGQRDLVLGAEGVGGDVGSAGGGGSLKSTDGGDGPLAISGHGGGTGIEASGGSSLVPLSVNRHTHVRGAQGRGGSEGAGLSHEGGDLGLLSLLLGLLRLAVEEQINHHVPRVGGSHGAAHLQDHAGQQVVHHTDGVLSLVVGRDGDVHMVEGGISVAESNHRDVHVRRLADGLVISAGVREDDQAGLHELLLDLVGEGT